MSMRYPGGLIATSPVNARYPSGVWTQAQAAPYQAQNVWTRDQFWPNTTLLLQGDGAVNGAQNNTFLDSSSNNFTITRNGNTTQGAFTPYEQDGYWSNYFNGGSTYIYVNSASALNLQSGAFTVEFWLFRTAGGILQSCVSNYQDTANGYVISINSSNKLLVNLSGDVADITGTTDVPVNQWCHIAISGTPSSSVRLFLNGIQEGSTYTGATAMDSTRRTAIGAFWWYSDNNIYDPLQGYISNFRILKGTALYTSAFTPPSAPLTAITNTSFLTCQSNRFKDNSSNNFAFTISGSPSVQAFQPFPGATTWSASVLGGSGYFDGSGDSLNAGDQTAFEFGAGAFTIEAWVYPTSYSSVFTIAQKYVGGDVANSEYLFYVTTAGRLAIALDGGGGEDFFQSATGVVPLNAWSHCAATKSGSTVLLFVNGVQVQSGTSSRTLNSTSTALFAGVSGTAGYMTDLRLLKGTALYTGAFTPPTAPLTAITNTSLLLNFTNAGIYDNSMMNNLETVGNAQVSTSVVKYGTGSMAFDGSGDWLIAPSTQQLSFSTGDFTVEMWVYATSVGGGTERFLFDTRAASADAGLAIYISTTGVLSVTSSNAVRATGGTITANSWIHVAVVRSSGAITVFLNGIPGSASSYSSSITCPGSVRVGIKTDGTTPYVGYLDDLRVTKGAARYITSFTPPPARLPAQ